MGEEIKFLDKVQIIKGFYKGAKGYVVKVKRLSRRTDRNPRYFEVILFAGNDGVEHSLDADLRDLFREDELKVI